MRKRPMGGAGDGRVSTVRPASEPGPTSSTEVSSPRVRVPDVVPTSWLDRLLVAVIDLPLASGERAVVQAVVDAVGAILPSYAVGACLNVEAGAGRRAPLVIRGMALHSGPGEDVDPARIFPGLSHEYVSPVPGSAGSTLHVASDDHDLEPDSSPAVHLVDRAAMALGRALPGARAAVGRREPALEARMIQTDKLATFGQIAAGVVHELNNPLTSIVAYSEYLIRKAASGASGAVADAEDVERLRRIHESANRMLRFTRELVTYVRPSTGVAGDVVLHEAIDLAVAFCEHVLAASSVHVDRRYSADMPAMRGANEQLVQVFINLLTNACQAAADGGGRVVIGTSHNPEASRPVVVEVEDNGGGIAPEHIAHVFAPFFTTKAHKNGTGLGLSIVKSIVESHDGIIRVESHLGRGTRFIIELPAGR
jgi:two-component system NtrC family sensor kinase